MLPKKFRLTTLEFHDVLQNGRIFRSGPVKIQYREVQDDCTKAAVVVPKSCDKRAVVRNRVKRVYRETLRHMLPALPTIHLVVTVYKEDVMDARKRIEDLLKRI